MEKKRRLASCLRRLFTTRSENSRRKREKKVFRAAKISFNIVAHSGLIEEAFSGHCYGRLKLGYFLLHSFCFSTHTVVFFNALGFQPALPCSTEQYARGCSFRSQRKRENASCVQRFAYLFRLTWWMLLQTPSRPPEHSAKSSHFPLNHQTGPMLSWTLSAIFSFF